MQKTLSLVTLGVSDLARSRTFYARLGWREAGVSKPEIAFFRLHGLVLALFPRQALADDAGVPAEGSGFAGITLAINVPSREAVSEVIGDAVAAGARITQPADDVFWGGYRGYFADPDGHLWEVCWNPFWPLDAAGAIQLPE